MSCQLSYISQQILYTTQTTYQQIRFVTAVISRAQNFNFKYCIIKRRQLASILKHTILLTVKTLCYQHLHTYNAYFI